MFITDKVVLVTGANRGIGRELVAEALARGARHVYAGTRRVAPSSNPRVTPIELDVTDASQIEQAAATIESLDVLVNNAGIQELDDFGDRELFDRHLEVNAFGPYNVTLAFLPHLQRSRGAVINNISLMAFAPLPVSPAYAVSKAAYLSLTQSMRALFAPRGVAVHAVFTGPTDTDMTRGLDIPKVSAESVARSIVDGLELAEEDIFPDPVSASMAEGWRSGAVKAFERQMAALVPAP